MKILLFTPEYPPYHIGGGGIVYKNLAEFLNDTDNDIVVIWGYYPTGSFLDKVENYEENNIRFYKIPEIPSVPSKPFLRTAMPPNIKGMLTIPKIIKKEKPDIIHFHGYGLPLIVYGAIICGFLKTPYVFTIHGFPMTPENNFISRTLWRIYEQTIMKATLQKAEKITCISKWLKENKRLKPYAEKTIVIYNGINTKKLQNATKNSEHPTLHEKYSLTKNTKILCSVGRISEMKGFHLVIKTIPKLLKIYPSCYYLIIGEDDGYKKNLMELADKIGVKNRVIFTGYIDEQTKLRYVKESDAYIVPSLWEPFGLTALEGLALKKIVITTGAGGLKEFLTGSRNVLFFDKKNNESLKDAIIKVLDGIKKYEEDNFLENFNWKNIVNQYLKVYKNILSER